LPSPRDQQATSTAHAKDPRRGRVGVACWLVAGAIYATAGALYPPVFLLGFQESVLYVFAVTWLAARVIRRFL
jgi:hypothetical protein